MCNVHISYYWCVLIEKKKIKTKFTSPTILIFIKWISTLIKNFLRIFFQPFDSWQYFYFSYFEYFSFYMYFRLKNEIGFNRNVRPFTIFVSSVVCFHRISGMWKIAFCYYIIVNSSIRSIKKSIVAKVSFSTFRIESLWPFQNLNILQLQLCPKSNCITQKTTEVSNWMALTRQDCKCENISSFKRVPNTKKIFKNDFQLAFQHFGHPPFDLPFCWSNFRTLSMEHSEISDGICLPRLEDCLCHEN